MEVKGADNHIFRVAFCEFLGTAALLYAINMSAVSGGFQPFAIGLTIAAVIHQFDPVTGAHFNPAVTIAVFIREANIANIGFLFVIIVAQILGATFGCLIVFIS